MERPATIQEDVARFLAENIDSIPQLEALLLLAHDAAREWTCDELAARLYVRPDACRDVLSALQRRQLISLITTSPPRYRYNSGWDESGLMAQVTTAYQRQLVAVTIFIHSRGSSAVREFARAFDLKKDH